MVFTPPAGVTPIDRKPPSSPTYADIPAVLDWLRGYYGARTSIGLLITDRSTGSTYRVDTESAYSPFIQGGPYGTYSLTPIPTEARVGTLITAQGVRNLGRAPAAGDPAGTYRFSDSTGTFDISWNGSAETGRSPALAKSTAIPRTDTVLSYGTLGQPSWDASTVSAAASVGPQGTLRFPHTSAGDAIYTFNSTPDLSGAVYAADPGVAISVPSVNGMSLKNWNLATPLKVIVRDRNNNITLPANVGVPVHLASLGLGDASRTIGSPKLSSLNMTTLEKAQRNTGSTGRVAGTATLTAGQAFWAQNSFGGTSGAIDAVLAATTPGLYLSAVLEGPTAGRAGVLIEQSDGGYYYISTGPGSSADQLYVGALPAGGGYVETTSALPTPAYSATSGSHTEYQIRIVGPREFEVSINGWRAVRRKTTSDLTKAGWAFYATGNAAGAQAAYNAVSGYAARAHVADELPIVVYGDSLMEAEGINLSVASLLPLALETALGIPRVTVTNYAISGQNTAQQRAAVDTHGAVGQRIAIWAVGTNDIQQQTSLSAVETDVRAAITRLQTDGAMVVIEIPGMYVPQSLSGAGFADANYDKGGKYRALLRRIAADTGCAVADTPAAQGPMSVLNAAKLKRDNLHDNLQGVLHRAHELANATLSLLLSEVQPAVTAAAPAFRGAMLTMTADTTLASGSSNASWTSALYDAGGWYNPTFPTRLTVPAGVSHVTVGGYLRLAGGNSVGVRTATIFKNGAQFAGAGGNIYAADAVNGNAVNCVTTGPIAVTGGDYFEFNVYQNSGGALGTNNVLGAPTYGTPPSFSVQAV
jgi:hypothetical protein